MPDLSLLPLLHGHHSSECQLDLETPNENRYWVCRGNFQSSQPSISTYHSSRQASNILLDPDFQACVADFGFEKLIPDDPTHETTRVKGTLGYLAPEYAMLGKASKNCDVYSFGILLLELATGKIPIWKMSATMKRTITDWALP